MLKNIQKTHTTIIVAAVILIAIGYFSLVKKPSQVTEQTSYPTPQPTENSTSSAPTSTSTQQSTTTQSDSKSVFNLDKKVAGTKLYYSEKLGIGFTYVPNASGTSAITVTEAGNKIYVHNTNEAPEAGQSIEVFTKDPKLTLEEAIKARFLSQYHPSDCFPKAYKTSLSNYVAAGIYSPPSDDQNNPSKNSDKCPAYYGDVSAVQFIQFFLMNKDTPGSFVFVRIGRAIIALDGTPKTEYNWSHSIRILK